jgi:hypothetical protein
MREESIAAFLTGKMEAAALNLEALESIARYDAIRTAVAIIDLDRSFAVSRDHIIRLCDAAIGGTLSEAALNAVAFALLSTDHFEWEDDIIAEVLNDWSAPEVNYPLTASNLSMDKGWLSGITKPPERPPVSRGLIKGKLVSQRLKVKELRPDWGSYSEILRKLENDA